MISNLLLSILQIFSFIFLCSLTNPVGNFSFWRFLDD